MGKHTRRKIIRHLEAKAVGRQPVLKAHGVEDLLGAIPALLGFHPRRSLVGIAVHDKRLGPGLRLDLPRAEYAAEAAEQIAGQLIAVRPEEVILVAYTDAGTDDDERAEALVVGVMGLLGEHGIAISEAIRCDGERWRSYCCDNPGCCPAEGTPYDISGSHILAHAVFNGVPVLPDREALAARLAAPDERVRRRMVEVTACTRERLLGPVGLGDSRSPSRHLDPRDPEHEALIAAGIDRLSELLDKSASDPDLTLSDEEVAEVGVWCLLMPVRDDVWARLTQDNALAHEGFWAQVARRTVAPYEPAVLTLAGFAAWIGGNGTLAICALERVAKVAPDYSMAALLEQILCRGLSPEIWKTFGR